MDFEAAAGDIRKWHLSLDKRLDGISELIFEEALAAACSGDSERILSAGSAVGCDRRIRESGPYGVYRAWHLCCAAYHKLNGNQRQAEISFKFAQS